MKKFTLFSVITLFLSLFAATPARAIEPIGAAVIGLITVGTHVLADQVRKGNLKAPPEECKTSLVKAATGNYYYQYVDPSGDCTYTQQNAG